MKKKRIVLIVSLITLVGVGLFAWYKFGKKKTEVIAGYTQSEKGYYYKLITIGDGMQSATKDNVLQLDVEFSTLNDSIFWDSKHDANNAFYYQLKDTLKNNTFTSHLYKLVEGDSCLFYNPTAAFFKEFFNSEVPFFCKKDSLVKIHLKLLKIYTANEYEQVKQAQLLEPDRDELQEESAIQNYLVSKKLTIQSDANGIFWLEKITTNDVAITSGKIITFTYKGQFLDGKLVDVLSTPMQMVYGTPDQLIKGLNNVIGTLKKGETVKIILPSLQAYGAQGSISGIIPPYTPLLYELTILDVK